MKHWRLIADGPLFLIRAGLALFRVYVLLAVAAVTIGMTVLFIALLLNWAFGIRWGW